MTAFRATLDEETDRGCALMAAAFLDTELSSLLKRRFVDDPRPVADLLRSSGPLGTFSSRIDLAYLLGLIGARVKRDLHLIRKIRNDFAHVHEPLSFESTNIRNRCSELALTPFDGATPRQQFTFSATSSAGFIHSATDAIKHIEPKAEREVAELRAGFSEFMRVVAAGSQGDATSSDAA